MRRPERPRFALDENFPQPILREALDRYVIGLRIEPLAQIYVALLDAYEDDELIDELARRGIVGLITCDDAMLWRPEVVSALERDRFSVVSCRRVGDDPVRASGLLLTHLGEIGRRHDSRRAQIWRLGTSEARPIEFAQHRARVLGSGREA